MFVIDIPAWKWVGGDWSAVPVQSGQTRSRLSVVTYNVWFDSYERKTRCQALGNLLGELQPDVIALQEQTLRMLQPLLQQDWVRQNYWCSASPFSGPPTHGVVLLARGPVPPLRLVQLPGAMGRRLLLADFPGLRLGVIHLESQALNGRVREQQMAIAWEQLAGSESSLLVGDFNFADEAAENALIPGEYVDLWGLVHPGQAGWTLDTGRNSMLLKHARRPRQQRFDRMLLRSQRWGASEIRLIGDQALREGASPVFCSDHFGLYLVLSRD
jgi:tyrosyl-DNA phosphodiesterase 2